MSNSRKFVAERVRGKYVFNYSQTQGIVSVIIYISSLQRLGDKTWEKIEGIEPRDGTLEIRVQTQKRYSTPEAEEIAKAAAVTRIMRYLERQPQTSEISERHVIECVKEDEIPWSYKPTNQSETAQKPSTRNNYGKYDLSTAGSVKISSEVFLRVVRGQPVGSLRSEGMKNLAETIRKRYQGWRSENKD